ncbi:MAG: hydrogenase formation protein HypD [Thermoplasmata archaeon]|nr:MAG: hydrogenase formation protein HypD [Thermoplasmata archaeon]
MLSLRDRRIADKIVDKIKSLGMGMKIMHVCGTHQDTVVKHGLDTLLLKLGIEVREGPGCPVCVTTTREIEEALYLARKGKTVAVFGDMLRAPGERDSLATIRAKGGRVRVVYSVDDAVKYAKEKKEDIVFFGVGFETTAPSVAATILDSPPDNFSVLSVHKLTPPATEAVLALGEIELNGVIDPGHVSTVIGWKEWEPISKKFKIPQVVAGFEPLDVLMAVYMIGRQISEGRAEVEVEYSRAVKEYGNERAKRIMYEVFEKKTGEWRGLGRVEESSLSIRKKYEDWDARKKYEDVLAEIADREYKDPPGCRCGDVIRGAIYPYECPLFGRTCTPSHPVGPCMVSYEGGCAIEYKYHRMERAKKCVV